MHDLLLERAVGSLPREACGLLGADDDGLVVRCYAAFNVAGANQFRISPPELYRIDRLARTEGRRIVGIYHSHPGGQGTPSRADYEGGADPAWVHVIVRVSGEVRAFDSSGEEVEVRVV